MTTGRHDGCMRRSRVVTRLSLALVGVLAVVGFGACTPSNPTSEPSTNEPAEPTAPSADCTTTGVTTQRDIRYATSPGTAANLQSLDLYTPDRPAACGATPVVVYVHGGGFRLGDKANKITDKVALFTNEGWAFASINYRLVGNPGSGPTNGVYPAAEEDVAAAIDAITSDAATKRIDPEQVMLLGHSAGAFLVSLVSTDGSFVETAGTPLTSIVCTASLDTKYDIPDAVAGGGQNALMFTTAFGPDPAVWAHGSPTNHVAPDAGIPGFHIVTRGTPDRVAQAQAFGTQLSGAGIAATVQVATGMSHEAVNQAVGEPGDTVITPVLLDFYRGCGE
jgi:arylformamidase